MWLLFALAWWWWSIDWALAENEVITRGCLEILKILISSNNSRMISYFSLTKAHKRDFFLFYFLNRTILEIQCSQVRHRKHTMLPELFVDNTKRHKNNFFLLRYKKTWSRALLVCECGVYAQQWSHRKSQRPYQCANKMLFFSSFSCCAFLYIRCKGFFSLLQQWKTTERCDDKNAKQCAVTNNCVCPFSSYHWREEKVKGKFSERTWCAVAQ